MISAGRTLAGLLRPAVRRASYTPVTGGIDYSRTPDPRWQAALDTMCPPSEQSSRLWLAWAPGDQHPFRHIPQREYVHRWVIFQLQPIQFLDTEAGRAIFDALEGPHPRTDAHWRLIKEPGPHGQTVLVPRLFGPHVDSPIDRLQWETYQALKRQGIRAFPRYFWIVQGPNGGHPYRLNSREAALWQLQGRYHPAPAETDAPGRVIPEAVYADMDQRVIDGIVEYDLWRYATSQSEPMTAAANALVARSDAHTLEANRLRWAAYGNKSEEIAPLLAHAMRQDGWHNMRLRPVGHPARSLDYDEVRHRFIHDLTERAAL